VPYLLSISVFQLEEVVIELFKADDKVKRDKGNSSLKEKLQKFQAEQNLTFSGLKKLKGLNYLAKN